MAFAFKNTSYFHKPEDFPKAVLTTMRKYDYTLIQAAVAKFDRAMDGHIAELKDFLALEDIFEVYATDDRKRLAARNSVEDTRILQSMPKLLPMVQRALENAATRDGLFTREECAGYRLAADNLRLYSMSTVGQHDFVVYLRSFCNRIGGMLEEKVISLESFRTMTAKYFEMPGTPAPASPADSAA